MKRITDIVYDPATGKCVFLIDGKPVEDFKLKPGEVVEFGFDEPCPCESCIGVIQATLAHFYGTGLPVKIIIGEKASPQVRKKGER